MSIRKNQKGGVSIFIVIFTALLLTVATTSFVQLMVRNQQQASTNDLSQSAYDAALAGVEDAKRALVALAKCEGKKGEDNGCRNLRDQFSTNSQKCEFLGQDMAGYVTFENNEVKVNADGADLNQAYTCVKVNTDNPDYRGQLSGDSSGTVVRLKAKEPFDRVKISWFSHEDLTSENPLAMLQFPSLTPADPNNPWPLLSKTAWGSSNPVNSAKTPPILRAQLIQFKSRNIELDKFDKDARTAFLYPVSSNADIGTSWKTDTRPTGGNTPRYSLCQANITGTDIYHCQATLEIPSLSGAGTPEIYVQLASIYSATHYSIELLRGTDHVDFSGGQAVVDSTGRAANLFRRISARVSVIPAPLKYPEAALTTKGDLCKNFFITNKESDYTPEACNPVPSP